MSIRETTILKGVAILFMLYLHLFNQIECEFMHDLFINKRCSFCAFV